MAFVWVNLASDGLGWSSSFGVTGRVPPCVGLSRRLRCSSVRRVLMMAEERKETSHVVEDREESMEECLPQWVVMLAVPLISQMLDPTSVWAAEAAQADSALKALFKTKVLSMAHPVAMGGFLLGALYTFYLGWKAQQVRKVGPEERKELIKGQFGKKHFETSSIIMTLMTIFTFEGMANTYTRTGKLFPGPHLYAGLGLVALMTVMASLVPAMQKGESWAKDVHFALAFVAIALFGWQAQSGLVIVGKLLGWS
eukprot:CAMPEP_0184685738 /NCGR_PEP_ID=MMETSP0312-20130426/20006_1 /TAXON_ID=31354 /ORGANISM="Compsopogon coeruleus, Strain SAG 36.94" /LENGTH=253 /DNA_ID=CAMNT_0027140139 /DNA_START=99 /DNA_END=860 /DNA_ORIENTATION=-